MYIRWMKLTKNKSAHGGIRTLTTRTQSGCVDEYTTKFDCKLEFFGRYWIENAILLIKGQWMLNCGKHYHMCLQLSIWYLYGLLLQCYMQTLNCRHEVANITVWCMLQFSENGQWKFSLLQTFRVHHSFLRCRSNTRSSYDVPSMAALE